MLTLHRTYTIDGQYHSVYDSFAWMDAYGGIEGQVGSAFSLIAYGSKIWGLLALRLADSVILPMDHVVQGEALRHYAVALNQQAHDLNLSSLEYAVDCYLQQAGALQISCMSGKMDVHLCNEKLALVERQFLLEQGLPDRKWFKHVLQAPGMYLGYAAEAFPGVQYALEMGDFQLAQEQVQVAAERISAAASFLGTMFVQPETIFS
jgi:N-acetylated-alpha-linked acidic dipeptidase